MSWQITGEWAFDPWPDGIQVQIQRMDIHRMDEDPFVALEGDIEAAREQVRPPNQTGPHVALGAEVLR